MGHFDGEAYVAEFQIHKSVADLWPTIDAPAGADPQWMQCWPSMQDGTRGEVLEVAANEHIRVRKLTEPCQDTLIEISMAAAEGADQGSITRVSVRQSQLPDWALHSIDTFVLGGDQIAADLALLLDRGVQTCRHALPWSFAGLLAREVATGLEVTMVLPGTWAQRLGLQAGDLLLTVGHAPVFTLLCLQAMQRVRHTGEEVAATWVRGSQTMSGSALL